MEIKLNTKNLSLILLAVVVILGVLIGTILALRSTEPQDYRVGIDPQGNTEEYMEAVLGKLRNYSKSITALTYYQEDEPPVESQRDSRTSFMYSFFTSSDTGDFEMYSDGESVYYGALNSWVRNEYSEEFGSPLGDKILYPRNIAYDEYILVYFEYGSIVECKSSDELCHVVYVYTNTQDENGDEYYVSVAHDELLDVVEYKTYSDENEVEATYIFSYSEDKLRIPGEVKDTAQESDLFDILDQELPTPDSPY